MKLSRFGKKFSALSGIGQLMEDLGQAMAQGDMIMLGGGNPAHIPEIEKVFRHSMEAIMQKAGAFESIVGNYDNPQGNAAFTEALARLMNTNYGWNIGPENIALTNGSQTAFFTLFNMFAGESEDGKRRKILFPLAPEYIGYADLGLEADTFTALKPEIEFLDAPFFKYHIDFDRLQIDDSIGALCVSRPTNPTGNVLTNDEVQKLTALAREADIPFILDNAYGLPFPQIIFADDATPYYDDNTIVCMSLSKLGLPSTRTGIVIAREEIIQFLAGMNAIIGLAPTGIGASIVQDIIESGEILDISRNVIRPWYEQRADMAVEVFLKNLTVMDFYIHKPEGALFLWLWFPDLPLTSAELYERLKKRGVLVVPGHYFFPGLEGDDWPHIHQCIRVSYAQDEKVVCRGIEIICDEVRSLKKK
ncbi:MAG: valine--pyruvate transaminase [Candidatus Sumerlaeia bacterium]